MATKTMISTAAANNAVLAVVNLQGGTPPGMLSSGSVLKIYTSNQPAGPDTAPGGGPDLLASLQLSTQPFSTAPAAGVATANAIAASTVILTGTAAWCRISSSSQATSSGLGVIDGTVGTASANCILNSVALSSGAAISISSLTVTMPESTS